MTSHLIRKSQYIKVVCYESSDLKFLPPDILRCMESDLVSNVGHSDSNFSYEMSHTCMQLVHCDKHERCHNKKNDRRMFSSNVFTALKA